MMFKISVIVPAFNVESYIDECIESLVYQTFKDFEIIVVNDGSTDSTRYILEKYEEKLSNLKVINQENSGSAGGPRNRGIEVARGEYIFFIDPDDRLPYIALEELYTKITKSKADIVCGNYLKFKNNSMWTVKHVTENIFKTERITTFNDEIELSKNILAWNKLYNKKFLTENNIYFDENLRYGEDRIFVMKAYTLAKSIHIIPNCIYHYRERETKDNKSATQEFTLKTFQESIEACKKDEEILRLCGCVYTAKEIYGKERVQHDFLRFIDYYALNDTSSEDWKLIIDISKGYISLLDEEMKLLTYVQRQKIKYIKVCDIKELVSYIKRKRRIIKIAYKNNRFKIVKLNNIKSESALDIADIINNDLNIIYRIEDLKINKETLHINGWAYIHKLDLSTKESVKKSIVFKVGKEELKADLETTKREDVNRKEGKIVFNYLYSGFEGRADLNKLRMLVSKDQPDVKIYLRLGINEDIFKEVYINKLDVFGYINRGNYHTITQRVEKIELYETYLKMSGWGFINYNSYKSWKDVDKRLIFVNRSTKKEYKYNLYRHKNDWCNTQFETNPYGYYYGYPGWNVNISYKSFEPGNYDIYLEISNNGICVREELKYPSWNLMKKRRSLETPYINFNRRFKWEFTTSEHNREECKFVLSVQSLNDLEYEMNGGNIALTGIRENYWDYTDDKEDILLKSIAVTYTSFDFWGTYLFPKATKRNLILECQEGKRYIFPCEEYDFLFINNKKNGWKRAVNLDIEDGLYILKLDILQSEKIIREIDKFKLTKDLNNNKEVWNKEHFIGETKVKFIKNQDIANPRFYSIEVEITHSKDNKYKGIMFKVFNKLNKKVDSITSKNKLIKKVKNKGIKLTTNIYHSLYRILSLLPINSNKITLVSYKQKMPTDYMEFYRKIRLKYPEIDIQFIGGNEKTFSQYIKMAYIFATSATILIDSYYRHLYNVKHRKGTKFIQVWHATGIFKRFGLLAVGKNQANTEEFEKNAHHYYTHVVVSGDEIVKPYAEAFGLQEDKIIPLGVSRTDELFKIDEHQQIKEKIYQIFPMFKGKKVILYAPTFRGNDSERKAFRNQLEFSKLKKLSEQGYIILYKMHPAVQECLMIPSNMRQFVYDVTAYPNINELFYISDLLITDYSSSIFEFALLRKPMIFFAYDLDKYLNERGFYYNYFDFVPGPICKKTDEVVECIEKLEDFRFEYDEFIKKYMNMCDGHATERLIKFIKK
jgi:CDP-glycerol glycerophosphotransferase (TagB/SpsB family)/glycosyltransferase involved in cell wall biosynthesis